MIRRVTGARATPAHGNQAQAGIQKPESLRSLSFRQDLGSPPVIYGQEVLYAARGQEAHSRPAQARLHGCRW